MLAVGKSMFLLIPSPSKTKFLHPGKVIESDCTRFAAEFEDAIAPEVGSDVNAFCEVNGQFYQQGAIVREIRAGLPVVIAFGRNGEVVSAENRQTYRVNVAASDISAAVGRESACAVLDVSPEGFAAVTSKKVSLGSIVPIKLHGEGHALEAPARVQTMRERPDGKFRYGFLVPRNNVLARKSLQQLSAAMQRLQLKRIRGAA
ncbi:MAG: PilZ domain-containing protein [Tepidisphaeraceae bacterium]